MKDCATNCPALSAKHSGKKADVTIHNLKVGTNGGTQVVESDRPAAFVAGGIERDGVDRVPPMSLSLPQPEKVRARQIRAGRCLRAVAELEEEAQRLREELHSTREEMQSSHEELKSANEELQIDK